MKKSRILTGIAAAAGMFVLILDTKTALSGASEGVTLCLRTVVPSLFPFFFLSVMLTGSLAGASLPLLAPVTGLLGIPRGAESILLAGFLGGYPVGAQTIGSAVESGQLSREDASRMLGFCNNVGPAFLFGIGSSLFPSWWMPWALWIIHIVSAMIVACMLPGKSKSIVSFRSGRPPTILSAMTGAIRIMAGVCGWIVLFRVLIAFGDRWFGWFLPDMGRCLLSGILELSNGCIGLSEVEKIGLRFVICSGFLAFGGLCVFFQTKTAAKCVDLRFYLPGKIMQTLLSILLSMLIQLRFPAEYVWNISPWLPAAALPFVFIPIILTKMRNTSGNPAAVGV